MNYYNTVTLDEAIPATEEEFKQLIADGVIQVTQLKKKA